MKNKPKNCKHEDGYGTTSMDGIRCFLCNKQLNNSQSTLLQAVKLQSLITTWYVDQKLLVGSLHGKKGYEKEYKQARDILIKLDGIIKEAKK